MCGIIGAWGCSAASRIHAVLQQQAHRGPDDQGCYCDVAPDLVFGHVRLSIQDLSPLAHQPMLTPDRMVALVFNGEIYNFRELRSELHDTGYNFVSQSDTEVLLALYLRDGVKMLSRLNGIFAFAVWDRRLQQLFVARDAFGVKPLYYYHAHHRFAFASELKALVPLLPDQRVLDHAALHRYLSFLWCPGDATPIKNVRKLGPGMAMLVRQGQIARHWQWYQLPVFQESELIRDERTAIDHTCSKLRIAVHRQLIADVSVGAFLSGGLDSSAVVAMARERMPDIRCFTIAPKGGSDPGTVDDLPYARRVAQHLNVPLDVVHIDANRMADDLERMVVQLDEPLSDPAPLNVLYISRFAREQGYKVLLSGAGGDDLFTGYRRHAALRYEHLWRWLPASARGSLKRWALNLDQRGVLGRRLGRLFKGADLEGDRRLVAYLEWANESDLFELYTPEFRAVLGDETAKQPMLDFLASLPMRTSPMDKMLALEQRFFLTDHNLNYTDKMSMAAGVEVRVPFLDIDLVAHAAKVPAGFKQKGRQGKWVLKKAMEPYLPKDVIYRAKSGFGAPLRRWMRNEFRPLVGDLLSADNLKRRGLFEPTAVQRLIAWNDCGKIDAAYTLLSLLSIEIWCRAYLDRGHVRIESSANLWSLATDLRRGGD